MANTVISSPSFANYWGKLKLGLGDGPELKEGGAPPYTSYPIPVRRQGQVRIAYMTGRSSTNFQLHRTLMWPPNTVVWIDPISLMSSGETAVTPEDFGQSDPPDKPFKGGFSKMDFDTFSNLQDSLFKLYDVLFTPWSANLVRTDHGKLQGPARQFLKIFDQISQPPLRPYYNTLGRDWFGWLRELAQ
jgi:hypothetical protein